ncbi:MAG: hypothetical protein AAGM22_06805 [Acidobacteriota bacterium]
MALLRGGGLVALTLVLALLPLGAHQPGQPPVLKADEPAYFLAALSLAHDGDLRVDVEDRRRLFENYPYLPVQNFIVMSDDGWRTLYFGKPYLYSLLAAPMTALWGARGMVAFNMLLLLAMVWMAASWLERHNPTWLARTFAVGFFVASLAWVYVYWLHPEVLNMFAGVGCLYFGLRALETTGEGAERSSFLASPWALVLSSTILALGVYNKPMMAALGLPVIFELLRLRRWRGLAVWLGGAVVSMALIAGGAVLLTGEPTAYLVELRAGFSVHDPNAQVVPIRPDRPAPTSAEEAAAEQKQKRAEGAGWWWLARIPDIKGFELAEDVPYFFLGRHTGLFLYQPFALLSIGLFLLYGRRRFSGWCVLVSTFAIGFFFLTFIPFNWHGGGGFVGNRYFVMAYPALLFLVTRIQPAWLLLPTFAAAGLFVGPMVISPHGLSVPQGTLQAHVRHAPFTPFPVELSLAEIPGYHGQVQSGLWLWGRKDQIRPVGEEMWLLAGDKVELYVQSREPVSRLVFDLVSPVSDNATRIELLDDRRELVLGTDPERLIFSPTAATRVRRDRSRQDPGDFVDIHIYRFDVEMQRGRLPSWDGEPGPRFFRGASLRVVEAEFGAAAGPE